MPMIFKIIVTSELWGKIMEDRNSAKITTLSLSVECYNLPQTVHILYIINIRFLI